MSNQIMVNMLIETQLELEQERENRVKLEAKIDNLQTLLEKLISMEDESPAKVKSVSVGKKKLSITVTERDVNERISKATISVDK